MQKYTLLYMVIDNSNMKQHKSPYSKSPNIQISKEGVSNFYSYFYFLYPYFYFCFYFSRSHFDFFFPCSYFYFYSLYLYFIFIWRVKSSFPSPVS